MLLRTLKALAVALLLLTAVEIWLIPREPPERDSGMFRVHPLRSWALRPPGGPDPGSRHIVKVNSLGLRGEEPGPAWKSVLLLGDSTVFGFRLKDEQTMAVRLQDELTRRAGRPVRVYNGGCPGYSSVQALMVLEEVAPLLRPDLVVAFYSYGDDNSSRGTDLDRVGRAPVRRMRALLWSSALYRWLCRSMGRRDLEQRDYMQQGDDKRVPPEDLRQVLREMKATSGARMAFVFLPNLFSDRAVVVPTEGTTRGVFLLEGARLGTALNLHEEWRKRRMPFPRLFQLTEIHPNAEGARLLAQDLADLLLPLLGDGNQTDR